MRTFLVDAESTVARQRRTGFAARWRQISSVGFLAALLLCPSAGAFESDVHFGLTQWLAVQAGFTPGEADAIATGDNRVDSGDMPFVDLSFIYSCLGADDEAAKRVSTHHFPTAGAVPGPAEQRSVVAGGDAALLADGELTKIAPKKAGFLLFKLGEALHVLQDSWSHQGPPDTPMIDGGLFKCDSTRVWAHPAQRGGWNSHKADLTMHWPADTLAMAKATYETLIRYPTITEARKPKDWTQVRPELDAFVKAATKTEKRAWFVTHGIDDVSFLEGTSLRDGPQPFQAKWGGRKLPPISTMQSRQHFVDSDVLDFFNRFFAEWMATDNLKALAATVTAPPGPRAAGAFAPLDANEIAAELALWRMRDHGAAAEFAHASKRLAPKQLAAVDAMAKRPNALVRHASATDAFFPLITRGKDASPLLPFVVSDIASSDRGNRRVVATAKFRHAPYDIVAIVAEKMDGQWRIISFASAVDH